MVSEPRVSEEDQREIVRLYTKDSWSLRDLAESYGVSVTTIRKYLRKQGVDMRAIGRPQAGKLEATSE